MGLSTLQPTSQDDGAPNVKSAEAGGLCPWQVKNGNGLGTVSGSPQ